MFSIKVTMTGGAGDDVLGGRTLSVPCPACSFYNDVFLRQVTTRDVVICRGCKANVHLDDHMGEVRVTRFQKAPEFGRLRVTRPLRDFGA